MVGRVLSHEHRRDRIYRQQPLRGQQTGEGGAGDPPGDEDQPPQHRKSHHRLRLPGRQHHPSPAGPQLDHPGLPDHGGHQEGGTGHHLHHPRGHRTPGHFRLRRRGAEGTPGDHRQLRHGRFPAAGSLRNDHRRRRKDRQSGFPFRGAVHKRYPGHGRRHHRRGGLLRRGPAVGTSGQPVQDLPAPLGPFLVVRTYRPGHPPPPSAPDPALSPLRHQPPVASPALCGLAGKGQPQTGAAGQSLCSI